MRRAVAGGGQEDSARGPLDPESRPCVLRASKAAASGCDDAVSTANDDGSSRRHSSHRYAWIPPTLGGKSLVTRRWVMPTA